MCTRIERHIDTAVLGARACDKLLDERAECITRSWPRELVTNTIHFDDRRRKGTQDGAIEIELHVICHEDHGAELFSGQRAEAWELTLHGTLWPLSNGSRLSCGALKKTSFLN